MTYEEKVSQISNQLVNRPKNKLLSIRKACRHMLYQLNDKDRFYPVDVSLLTDIIEINTQNKTAIMEGAVTLGALCKATLKHHLMPAVVPEFEDFTVAGLINGFGGESSSHIHGLFTSIISEMEVILPSGEILTLSPELHSDLFYAIFGSLGTIAIIAKVTLKLIPAEKYVCSSYQSFNDIKPYVEALKTAINNHLFVEGIIINSDEYVLITGDFCDSSEGYEVYKAMEAGNLWYYQHVSFMAKNAKPQDVVPIYDYLFRHQRSAFWLSAAFFPKFIQKSRFLRKIIDKNCERYIKKNGFQLVHSINSEKSERNIVVQDLGIDLNNLEEYMQYVQKNFKIYPLWNCVFKNNSKNLLIKSTNSNIEYVVDVGIYGIYKPNFQFLSELNKLHQISDVFGVYGTCYSELHEIFDIEYYEAIRQKYGANEAYPHFLEKKIPSQRPKKQIPNRFFRIYIIYKLMIEYMKMIWRR